MGSMQSVLGCRLRVGGDERLMVNRGRFGEGKVSRTRSGLSLGRLGKTVGGSL